jgi:hypothetical protein
MSCACCGETEFDFLSLDHVNNDGQDHRKSLSLKGGGQFYVYLIKNGFPNDPPLQVACFNCNYGKRINGGICPHKERPREDHPLFRGSATL